MKRSNQLKFFICALLMSPIVAQEVEFDWLASGDGNNYNNSSEPNEVSNTVNTEGKTISCERGSAIPFGFLKSVSRGMPEFKTSNGQLHINMPFMVTACLAGPVTAEAITNESDNNVYVRFNAKVDTSLYDAGNGSFEEEYAKCTATLYEKYPDLKKKGQSEFVKHGFYGKPKPIVIDLKGIDSSRDSQVVVASPDSANFYKTLPFGQANVNQDSIFKNSKYNCMHYAKPADSLVMANKTRSFYLKEEALAACNGKNLADIADSLRKLRSDSSGNYDQLTSILSSIQSSLISEKIDETIKKMEVIEAEMYPSEEDIANGDKYGVSKSKRKQLIKDYANLMKEFTSVGSDTQPDEKGYLQILKDELKHLMDEAENLGDTKSDETRRTAINESIEEINELISKFNRQKENGAEYRRLVEAMRESNSQISGKKVLEGIILAQEFSNVKLEGDGKRTLEKAESNSSKEIKRLDRNTLAIWGDEAKIRAGDKSPIAQRKKIVQGIQQRAAKDRQKFAQKQSAYDEYIQQYASDLVSSYCTSGGNYQDCMTVRNTYVPHIYNQYMGWKQNNVLEYNDYYSNKFGTATTQQNNILTRYNSLYSEYQLNQLQNKFNNQSSSYDGGFDLWTGADTSGYSSGIPGLNFNLSGPSNQNSWSNNNNFSIMNNQQRTPSSGGSWANPFQ